MKGLTVLTKTNILQLLLHTTFYSQHFVRRLNKTYSAGATVVVTTGCGATVIGAGTDTVATVAAGPPVVITGVEVGKFKESGTADEAGGTLFVTTGGAKPVVVVATTGANPIVVAAIGRLTTGAVGAPNIHLQCKISSTSPIFFSILLVPNAS